MRRPGQTLGRAVPRSLRALPGQTVEAQVRAQAPQSVAQRAVARSARDRLRNCRTDPGVVPPHGQGTKQNAQLYLRAFEPLDFNSSAVNSVRFLTEQRSIYGPVWDERLALGGESRKRWRPDGDARSGASRISRALPQSAPSSD